LADRAKLLLSSLADAQRRHKFGLIQNGRWFPPPEVAEFALGKAAQDRGHHHGASTGT
jgi:hypothetical protein